jgi:hypothetical protein
VQRLEQHFLGREIQVVGRLVENEEVRRLSSIRAITSRVFSPPDSIRIFLSVSSPENWKAPARFLSAPIGSSGKSFLQLLLDRQIRIEHVEGLLREVPPSSGSRPA